MQKIVSCFREDSELTLPVELLKTTTALERMRGLLGRSELKSNEGLWLDRCASVHTFFMKYALDLVYLDKQGKIVKLVENLPPYRCSGCYKATSVVELLAGEISRLKLAKGMIMQCEDSHADV